MEIRFPATAVPLAWKVDRGLDTAIWLKLSVPPRDVSALISASPFGGLTMRNDRRYPAANLREAWWRAEQAVNYQSAETQLSNGAWLSILIDCDDTQTSIVYLFWVNP